MNQNCLTRENLYAAVWSEPARDLAKRYGISDVALAKTCKRLRIPKPGRGYWRQKQCGKRVRRPPLPKLKPDEREKLTSVIFGPRNPSVTAIPEQPTGPLAEQKQYEADHPIKVPKHMGKPHPIVRLTLDERKKPYYKCRGLDIKVGKDSRGRALRIMNTLVKALERRGFAVRSSAGEKGPTTRVDVSGTQLGIRLEERRGTNTRVTASARPSGLFNRQGRATAARAIPGLPGPTGGDAARFSRGGESLRPVLRARVWRASNARDRF